MSATQSTPRARVKASVERAQHEEAQRLAAERLAAAHDDFLASMKVSLQVRHVVSVVVGLLSYGVTVYYVSSVVNTLTALTLMSSGSTLLAFLVMLLGYALAIYSAMWVGYRAAKLVGTIDFEAIVGTARDVRAAAASKVSLVREWIKPTRVYASPRVDDMFAA